MAPVVRLVEVLVAHSIGRGDERLDELPRLRPLDAAGIDADVEIAPDHQSRHVAADEDDAAGGGKPFLHAVQRQELARLGAQLLRTREELGIGH